MVATSVAGFDFLIWLSQKTPIRQIQERVMRGMNLPKIPNKWEEIEFLPKEDQSGFIQVSFTDQGFLDSLPKEHPVNREEIARLMGKERERSGKFPVERMILEEAGGFIRIRIRYPNRRALGLGDKTGSVNRRGSFHFWNLDDANHGVNSDPLYQSHPILYLIEEKVGVIIVDSPAYQFWNVDETGIEVIVKDRNFRMYLSEYESLPEAYRGVTSLLGTFTLPPAWALGYQQSRWSYLNQDRFLELARNFRENDIPCDVFYMDIDYMEGFRCFTLDKTRFPNLKSLADEIPQKLVAIIDPGIKVDDNYSIYREGLENGFFLKDKRGSNYIGRVWPGNCHFPDFSNEEVREWWGGLYRPLVEKGVSGFWNDMNEPSIFSLRRTFPKGLHHHGGIRHEEVHNAYGLLMSRATFESLRKLRPHERPFVLTRSSYLGGQNYAWMWTGDNKSTWEFLRLSVRQLQSISISGQPLCGADVGGFLGNPDPELMVRWTQLGVFYPLFRNHTAQGTKDQEPWNFPEFLPIIRETIRLRYKLLPYIYTQTFLSSLGFGPLIRPLSWLGERFEGSVLEKEFLFGENLLVAPVLEPVEQMEVILPAGYWFDFFTGERYRDSAIIDVDMTTIPIFVRSGSSIPIAKEVRANARETLATGVEVRNFGTDPKGVLYQDDGESMSYLNGDFKLLLLPSMEQLFP